MFGRKDSEVLLNQSGRSYIAESMQLEGEIHSSGAVDVAGLISGNVNVKEMIIFDTGSVKGKLHAVKLNVNGHIDGGIVAEQVFLGKNAVVKGDILFKISLKTEEGAEIDGYIKKGIDSKKHTQEEDKDIEEIFSKPELGKPTLVKNNEKEAV